MRIIDRFDKYMKNKGLNDNKVTVQLGLSTGLIGKARKEGADLGKKTIDLILSFYTDLNRIWLLTGDGEMRVSDTKNNIRPPDASNMSFESVKVFAHLEQRISELKDENNWLKRQIELKDEQIKHFLNRGGEVIQPDQKGTSGKK